MIMTSNINYVNTIIEFFPNVKFIFEINILLIALESIIVYSVSPDKSFTISLYYKFMLYTSEQMK